MYYIALLNQIMLLQSIGAEISYLGWFRFQGQVFIVMVHQRLKVMQARKKLLVKAHNQLLERAPDQRLNIDGVFYVS